MALGRSGDYFASGVIIEGDIILTAAHICDGQPDTVPDCVWYGPVTSNCLDAPKKGELLRVVRYMRHSQYEFNGNHANPRGNDLMMLEIHPDDRKKIHVIAEMANDDEATKMGVDPHISVRAVGYGHSRKNVQGALEGFGVRRHVTIPLAGREVGRYGLFEFPVNDMKVLGEFVAASKSENADTCKGDSGGPVYLIGGPPEQRVFRLIGITSRATPGAPDVCGDGGVYELVPAYRDWIRAEVQKRGSWPTVQ